MPIHLLHPNSLENLPVGKHADGAGLYLRKTAPDKGKWIYRFTFGRTQKGNPAQREMGLGSWHAKKDSSTSLAKARSEHARWKAYFDEHKGERDPIAERERLKRQAEIDLGSKLSQIVADTFDALKPSLRDGGKAGRWDSPLRLHVLPRIGHMPISQITQHELAKTLRPIWRTKADTARKAMNRLKLAFDHAAAMGLPVTSETVRQARVLLGDQGAKPVKIPAMDYKDVPEFYESLGDSPTELALKLTILTAIRSKPVRFCQLDQIDGDVWVIPAEYMKGREGKVDDFHIPLSGEAIGVIEAASQFERNGFLFSGARRGVISDATMSRYMERRGLEARPHGFRSSFKEWAENETEAPRELVETCLAHTVGAVEGAYLRNPRMLERRRNLLEGWANFVTRQGSANLISLVV